jgi:hypothetical protein
MSYPNLDDFGCDANGRPNYGAYDHAVNVYAIRQHLEQAAQREEAAKRYARDQAARVEIEERMRLQREEQLERERSITTSEAERMGAKAAESKEVRSQTHYSHFLSDHLNEAYDKGYRARLDQLGISFDSLPEYAGQSWLERVVSRPVTLWFFMVLLGLAQDLTAGTVVQPIFMILFLVSFILSFIAVLRD